MSDSELSSVLSSPPSSDHERHSIPTKSKQRPPSSPGPDSDQEPSKRESPARKKRAPSPPHEEVLADNGDIAFIVMFRSRFSDAFPPKLAQFGPQDIERGVVDSSPSPQVESLLCALLGLVLNRQKPVERGHYGRALEEAISKFKPEWPTAWNGRNPLLAGGPGSFENMSPVERLILLKYLIMWALHSSDAISNIIKESFKGTRTNDDIKIPLSVQPWGKDAQNRQYWLIEGRDDTSFRLYREGNRKNVNIAWRSEAGTIDELKAVAQKLADEGGQASRRLSERIMTAIPRFEATEEKRKRREYRQSRKAAFQRPTGLDYGLYEGRTRGKRLRYTYDDDMDDDEDVSDATDLRRSARHSGRGTPADTGRPTVTASGRQVRSRMGGLYGESLLSGQTTGRDTPMTGEYERSEMSEEPVANGRATRSSRHAGPSNPKKRKHIDTYNSVDSMDDEEDAESSGADWENPDGDDERGEDLPEEEDEDKDMDEEDSEDEEPHSLIVKLKLSPSKLANGTGNSSQGESAIDSGISTAAYPTTSPSTAPSVNGTAAPAMQKDVPMTERLVPQTTKPLYSPPMPQMQSSIASFFQPKPAGTG